MKSGINSRHAFPFYLPSTAVPEWWHPHEARPQQRGERRLLPAPLATVGMTEEQAVAAVGDVDVYTSSFRPMKNTISGSEVRHGCGM